MANCGDGAAAAAVRGDSGTLWACELLPHTLHRCCASPAPLSARQCCHPTTTAMPLPLSSHRCWSTHRRRHPTAPVTPLKLSPHGRCQRDRRPGGLRHPSARPWCAKGCASHLDVGAGQGERELLQHLLLAAAGTTAAGAVAHGRDAQNAPCRGGQLAQSPWSGATTGPPRPSSCACSNLPTPKHLDLPRCLQGRLRPQGRCGRAPRRHVPSHVEVNVGPVPAHKHHHQPERELEPLLLPFTACACMRAAVAVGVCMHANAYADCSAAAAGGSSARGTHLRPPLLLCMPCPC